MQKKCRMTDKQFLKVLKEIRQYVSDVQEPKKIEAYLTEMIERMQNQMN